MRGGPAWSSSASPRVLSAGGLQQVRESLCRDMLPIVRLTTFQRGPGHRPAFFVTIVDAHTSGVAAKASPLSNHICRCRLVCFRNMWKVFSNRKEVVPNATLGTRPTCTRHDSDVSIARMDKPLAKKDKRTWRSESILRFLEFEVSVLLRDRRCRCNCCRGSRESLKVLHTKPTNSAHQSSQMW